MELFGQPVSPHDTCTSETAGGDTGFRNSSICDALAVATSQDVEVRQHEGTSGNLGTGEHQEAVEDVGEGDYDVVPTQPTSPDLTASVRNV